MNINLTFDGNDEGPFARLVLIHPNRVPRRLEVLLDPGRACLERASAFARLDDYLLLGACCCCLFRRGLPRNLFLCGRLPLSCHNSAEPG